MRTRLVLLLVVAGTSACDLFGPSGPGVLDATLTSTNDLGAVVLEVSGTSVTGIRPHGNTHAFSGVANAREGRHRVVLVSPDGGAMRFGIEVDDLGADDPIVTVVTAADVRNLPSAATGVVVRVER